MIVVLNPVQHRISPDGRTTVSVVGASAASSCFTIYRVSTPAGNTGIVTQVVKPTYLTASDQPVLARIWDNESDAIFDTL